MPWWRAIGFQPRNVAAITFTNKAAKEMQERIGKLLSKGVADQLQISTFHSLGVRIMREEAKALGYKPRFSIFDSADCAGIIGDVAKTVDKGTLRHLQSIISNWKNALVSPEAARQLASNDHEVLAAHAFLSYEATLKAYQAMDFDDLIGLPVKLFSEFPEIREKWQNRLRYLLVDEYQDTNACQYQVLKLLTRRGAGADAAANAVSRTPGGHPEGYLEGFANIYAGAAQAIRAADAGTRDPVLDLLPGLEAGLAGMRFIAAAIRSSRADSAWVTL